MHKDPTEHTQVLWNVSQAKIIRTDIFEGLFALTKVNYRVFDCSTLRLKTEASNHNVVDTWNQVNRPS